MIASVRAVWGLFGRRRRARWVLLSVLVGLTSGMEAVAAATVFALVSLLSTGHVGIPLLGELSVRDGDLVPFAVATIGVFAVRAAVVVLHDWVLYRLCYGAGAETEEALLRGYLLLPPRRIRHRGHAQLVRNVHDTVMTVVEECLIPLVLTVGSVLQTAAVVAVMLAVAPLPTLAAALLYVPVLWLVSRALRRPARRLGSEVEAALGSSLAVATETLDLAAEIRAAGRTEQFAERFGAVRRGLARAGGTEEVLRGLPRLVGETALVLFVLAYVATAVATAGGHADAVLPTIGLFAYAALRILPSLLGIVGTVHSVSHAGPALETVVRDQPLARSARGASYPPGIRRRAPGTVELRGAVVRAPGTGRPVLEGVDLCLRRGDVVAVVGPNGAGKSTLVDVLAGVLPLDGGEVVVDGTPLGLLEDVWPAQVAVVAQHVHLMDADIATNITLDPSGGAATDPDVASAIDAVGLGPVVERLDGAAVGEDGRALSGGERQRVAVARALHRSAGVLLVDEGTSALDPASRDAFLRLVNRDSADRITVLVTHDPDLARSCARVLRVEDGAVRECTPAVAAAPASVRPGGRTA